MHEANPFETHYMEYDRWFDENANLYQAELLAVRAVLPPNGKWVEIGVGSGRFASELGIPVGIEPAERIATLARARGVRVIRGRAEALPLEDESVDAVFLITTLCFIDDADRAFQEAARVLRCRGHAVVAFIPSDSAFGRLYRAEAAGDRFFRRAILRTKQEVYDALHRAGLNIECRVQTLTGSPSEAGVGVEKPTEGDDVGSFVVVRARKISFPTTNGGEPGS